MRLITNFLLLCSLSLLIAVCTLVNGTTNSNGAPTYTLTVFTAASLTEAFTEIGKRFEDAHPRTHLLFNFAGSQQLTQQIAQGAPADVFASADEEQMLVAVQSGEVKESAVRIFANNRLLVIFPRSNPAGITRLQDLAKPGLKLVLANPAVPVGNYSLEFLAKAGQEAEFAQDFQENVLENVVSYEENVKAVVSKIALGEADAGIVYTSDISPANAEDLGSLEIPDALNVVASYYIAPLEDSSQSALASDFIAFVLSGQGQDILAQFSLLPVQ